MSTILKALKKAEDGRAKETLPGKITIEEAPEPAAPPRRWVAFAAATAVLALAAAALYALYPLAVRKARSLRTAAPPTQPSPPAARQPAPPPAEEAPALRLSGVMWDKENPIAIVNGQPVSPGEEVSGARVVKITVNSVVFSRGGKEITVTVHE